MPWAIQIHCLPLCGTTLPHAMDVLQTTYQISAQSIQSSVRPTDDPATNRFHLSHGTGQMQMDRIVLSVRPILHCQLDCNGENVVRIAHRDNDAQNIPLNIFNF